MKKPIFLMLAICALTFTGCSLNSSESLDNEIQNSEDFQTTAIEGTDFKIVSTGIFETSDSKTCDTKGEFYNRGVSSTGSFGELTAQFSICTDFEGYEYFSGSYTTDEGDQFWFTSEDSGIDEVGKWYLLNIDGGTGMFENAIGEITIYRIERYSSEDEGTFTDSGKGIINY